MKKVSFVVLILCFFAKASFGQEGFKLGLKVNPIVSFVTLTDSSKTKIPALTAKPRLGYAFGLMVNYGFSKTIGIHTGVHIVNKGYSGSEILTDLNGGTHNKGFKQSMMTVEVPLALKLRSPEIGTGIFITGLFGVAPEINISNRYDTQDLTTTIDSVSGVPVVNYHLIDLPTTRKTERLNLVTLAFLVGVGVDWQFDWGMITMGPSFHLGLLDLLRRKYDGNLQRHSKLNYIALDLGYYF